MINQPVIAAVVTVYEYHYKNKLVESYRMILVANVLVQNVKRSTAHEIAH